MNTSKHKKLNALTKAKKMGIDTTLLYENIHLTPTQRIEKHQRMLEFVEELKRTKHKKDLKK